MGQICSFCRYLCCCATGNFNGFRAKVTDSDSDNDSFADSAANQQTHEYIIPSEHFKNDNQVFASRGYRKDSMNYIADGGQAQVFRVTKSSSDKKQLAVKVIHLRTSDERYKSRVKSLTNEIRIISRITHRNIIRLEDYFFINNTCYLFMELANGGTLEDEVRNSGRLQEPLAKHYFLQIARAVKHLHCSEPPIAHNDLKLNNILIHWTKNEKLLKVTDFGFGKMIEAQQDKANKVYRMDKPKGTLPFMSPQLINLHIFYNLEDEDMRKKLKDSKQFKPKTVNPIKADIWALGVCLYRMVSGQFPFDFPTDYDWKKMFLVMKEMQMKNRKPIDMSAELKNLLDQMLEPDTKHRIEIKDIVDHQWLAGVPKKIILNATSLPLTLPVQDKIAQDE